MEEFILDGVSNAGYIAVFAFAMLEAMCVPIPSEVILGVSALLIVKGMFSFLPAMLSGWAGSVCGSTILYFVFRRGGRPLAYRYGRYIKLTPARLDRFTSWFERFGPALIVPWWQIPGLRAKVGAVTGLMDLRPRVFIVMTILATGLWNFIGLKIAISFGRHWAEFLTFITDVEDYIYYVIGVAAIGLVVLWYWRRAEKRKKSAEVV